MDEPKAPKEPKALKVTCFGCDLCDPAIAERARLDRLKPPPKAKAKPKKFNHQWYRGPFDPRLIYTADEEQSGILWRYLDEV